VKIDYGARLRKFAAEVKQLNTEKLYLEAARDVKELASDLNRLQLLTEGIDGDGKKLGRYSEGTKKKKRAKGQETEFITLYDEGNFQEGIFLNTKQLPIFLDSKDSKTPILKARYGDKILALTKSNQEEFGNEVKQRYIVKTNKAIEVLKEKILL